MTKERIVELINQLLKRQNKPLLTNLKVTSREAQFRSLDFAELTVKIELELGYTLDYGNLLIKYLENMEDTINVIMQAISNSQKPS